MKKGKDYELLIEQIYRELQGDAAIKQDELVEAYESGSPRQIDVTIRYTIADLEMLLIVQAKDWQKPAHKKVDIPLHSTPRFRYKVRHPFRSKVRQHSAGKVTTHSGAKYATLLKRSMLVGV